MPSQDVSLSERRSLAKFPSLTTKTLVSGQFMSSFETYTLDQFPARDTFRALKSWMSLHLLHQKDSNLLFTKGKYISKIDYPLNESSIDYVTQRFQFLYNQYFSSHDMNIYLSIIPDKNYFMSSDILKPDYQRLVQMMQEKMNFSQYIDLFPLLKLSDYYYTDTHWKQENLIDIARYIADEMNVSLNYTYETKLVEHPFYGVYRGQLALPDFSDQFYYLYHSDFDDYRVFDYETQKTIPVYDFEKLNGSDFYEFFLSGSKSLLTIENPHAKTSKELIVFRDSFGSSLIPLLCEGYAKVTAIDIRYLSPHILDQFITFENQDILFLYSTLVLNHSETIK